MKEWCYYFILAKRLGRETYPDMSNTLGTSVCGMCVCTQICVYILPYAMQNQGTLLLFGEFGAWITHNRKNGSGAPSCDQCFQFSSVAQSCPTLCDPMDCSPTGFPGHHQLPEFFAFCHKGGVICISKVISPGNLDSSLCFIQPSISHEVLCISVK